MDGEPPSSMLVVNAREVFPVGVPQYDNQPGEMAMPIPFTPLTGESVKYIGRTSDGLLGLSNYRLYVTTSSEERSIPLGLIEYIENPDPSQLNINCKDLLRVVKCSFDSYEKCQEWTNRVATALSPPALLESYFAFPFFSWAVQWSQERNPEVNNIVPPVEWLPLVRRTRVRDDFKSEIERLQFDLRGAWRVTQVNSDYSLCSTYPKQLLVPASVKDEELPKIAAFRSSRRIPTIVWRHRGNGAVLARCSQPEVGILGWRCNEDEEFIKAMSNACSCDSGCWSVDQTPSSSPDGSHEEVACQESKKVLIVDARSYASAVTNKVRGGGCECSDYYYAEVQFMSMANIHVIRGSFERLRALCSTPPEHPKWLSALEHTGWLHHLSSLFHGSSVVVRALHKIGRPVLVHCSDGWDRTPQIVATAELCLDPFYRTVEGFRILVEREWLNFGHKFAERNGHHAIISANERCPVFIQWLDAVHQLLRQFPCSFEFNTAYLIKLAQHSYTCLFGTFLCNNERERNMHNVPDSTFSVWQFVENPAYRNHLYVYNKDVLWPKYNVRDLVVWSEVYLSSLENRGEGRISPGENFNNSEIPPPIDLQEASGVMIKTRSYGDLLTAGTTGNPTGLNFRRLSDPSVIVDPIKLNERSKPTDDFVDGDYCVNEISINHGNQLENVQNETTILSSTNKETGYTDEENHLVYQSNIIQPFKNDVKSSSDTLDSVDKTLNEIYETEELLYSNKNNKSSDIMNVKNISLTSTCNLYITNEYNGDHIVNGEDRNFNNICEANLEQNQNGIHNGSDDDKDSVSATEEDFSNGPSIETSTDTLVPHLENYRASNGQMVDVHWPFSECGTSERNSQYSTPSSRGFSRAPSAPPASSPGLPPTPPWPQVSSPFSITDSIDGLGHGINEEGLRLQQLVFEHKMREDALKKELQSVRMSMMTHLCAQCYSRTDIPDRADESPAPPFITEHTRCSYAWKPMQKLTWPDPDNVLSFMMDSRNAEIHQMGAPPCGEARGAPNTLVKDSLNSLTDSVGASGASDSSWEAVEDRPGYIHGPGGVLWVPDHAVSRCTSCETQFWLGRRKHHCRSCGYIFCADCSEHYAPLPTENLYTPVRLCTPCYHKQSVTKVDFDDLDL